MEHYVAAMHEADWQPELLQRRLRVFDMRARGVPMEQIAKSLDVCERTIYYDWEAIRGVVVAAAAPDVEAIRAKADARLERIYMLAMAEIGAALQKGSGTIPRAMLAEARHAAMDQAKLHGLTDQRLLALLPVAGGESRELAEKSDDELAVLASRELEALAEIVGRNGGGNGEG